MPTARPSSERRIEGHSFRRRKQIHATGVEYPAQRVYLIVRVSLVDRLLAGRLEQPDFVLEMKRPHAHPRHRRDLLDRVSHDRFLFPLTKAFSAIT